MLVGIELSGQQLTLDRMQNSSYKFHLTGSRFFGKATQVSDWDFFCENSQEIRNFLRDLGFRELSKTKRFGKDAVKVTSYEFAYVDQNVAEVWRHKLYQIDVQLQKDVGLKLTAQNILKEILPCVGLAKEQRFKLWNAAFRAARA